MSLYFTKPIARTAIWGTDRLARYFGYQDMTRQIGQCWAFSCQKGLSSPLEDGGTLAELWDRKPGLFKSRCASFPFIISLVAPADDLSIQIHPNDEVAKRYGYPTGKNEAWVFLAAPGSGRIVYGQRMRDEAGFRDAVRREAWEEIIAHKPVQQGDFVYLPAGMLHALSEGSVVYEIQQATDVTYRFYDYHRVDAQGQARPLHVEQAIECINFSLDADYAPPKPQQIDVGNVTLLTYIQNESFCIRRFQTRGDTVLRFPLYQLITVSDGDGAANGHPVRRGSNFLLPADEALRLTGSLTLMSTSEG